MISLRRSLKILSHCTLAVASLVSLGFVLYVMANWTDEPLSAPAQQALAYTPPTEQALEGNGYLIMAGLDAPAEGDLIDSAYALGRKRLALSIERRDWLLHQPWQPDTMPPDVANAGQAPLPSNFACAIARTEDCFAWYQTQASTVHQLLDQYHAPLARYAAAALTPQFSNPFAYDILLSTPPFTPASNAHTLLLAKAALQWPQQPADALDTFAIAAEVRARLGNNANSLVDAMLALSRQYKELHWLSNAAATTRASTPTAISEHLTHLLNQPPAGLQSSYRGEAQGMAVMYIAAQQFKNGRFPDPPVRDTPSWQEAWYARLESIGYLPNATANQSIKHFAQLQELAGLPANALQPAVEQWLAHNFSEKCSTWYGLRNWAGKCIVEMSFPNYPSYIQRAHDIDGYRRLVLLQQQALAQHITAANMPAWLNQSPPALRNPYTLEPMQWDAASNSLVFEGKERQSQNPDASATYRVRLGTPG